MPTKSLNKDLNSAKAAKKDEFYTQYVDIRKEVDIENCQMLCKTHNQGKGNRES